MTLHYIEEKKKTIKEVYVLLCLSTTSICGVFSGELLLIKVGNSHMKLPLMTLFPHWFNAAHCMPDLSFLNVGETILPDVILVGRSELNFGLFVATLPFLALYISF